MTHETEHCQRPWWKRPPFWFVVAAAVALLIAAVIEQSGGRAVMPYGAFLDQVEADNVASVTFQGTEINGKFKHPLDTSPSTGKTRSGSFRTHVPDFGDPALIPTLRSHHVAIDVASPSAWSWLLGRIPWPMLIFVGVLLVAGFVRLVRGGKAQVGSAAPGLPAHGMIGLVSGLFAGRQAEGPHSPGADEPKSRPSSGRL